MFGIEGRRSQTGSHLTGAVRRWVRRSEVDAGARPGTTAEEPAELKRLKRENAELRRTNAILKAAACGADLPDRPSTRVVGNWRGRQLARQRRHFAQEHKDEIVRMVLDGPAPHRSCSP